MEDIQLRRQQSRKSSQQGFISKGKHKVLTFIFYIENES